LPGVAILRFDISNYEDIQMSLKTLFIASYCAFLLGCGGSGTSGSSQSTQSLSILNINDFHGQLEQAYNDPNDPSKGFMYPGAARITTWVKEFKQTHQNVLFLAGGDNYQGTMLDNYYHGDSVSGFFNILGINYSALGNHEFDFSYNKADPTSFIYNAINKGMGFIASNVVTDNAQETPVDFVQPYKILKTMVGNRMVNIVIIGLATVETPITTSGSQGLKFKDPAKSAEAALNQAEMMLWKTYTKPDIVLFLTHTPSIQKSDPYIPNPNDPVIGTISKFLDPENSEIHELTQWIASRNEIKNISVVLSAHSHKMVNGYVAGNSIPVVQGGYNGRGISIVNITCPSDQRVNCSLSTDVVDLTLAAGTYTPDPEVTALVNKYLNDPTYQQMATREITTSCLPVNVFPVYNNFNFKLHYLIANQLRHSQQTTIGVYNLGGLRANLPAGKINFNQLYNTMPFDTYNLVETGKISGSAIRKMVDDNLHLGAHTQIAIAGIAFNGIALGANEHYTGPIYLTYMGSGYRDPADGGIQYDNQQRPILLDDNSVYTIAAVDFLLDADPRYPGDGYDFTMVTDKQYPIDTEHNTRLTVRQMFENELVKDKIPGACQDYTPYNWINALQP
jgi:2',3'-cyclic-nucleotide 2'-phosphodiesterase/3'-nucleotidase